MKCSDMEKLKPYIVTCACSVGKIVEGDIIWISLNGNLNSVLWAEEIKEDEWDRVGNNDFEVDECAEYYVEIGYGTEKIRKIIK